VRPGTTVAACGFLLVCSKPSAGESRTRGPERPQQVNALSGTLNSKLFISRRFVTYTDLWGTWLPNGDPIVFHADGTVDSEKAGLRGKWKIVDEATVLIADRKFSYSSAKGCLFSPLKPDAHVGWYILLEDNKQQWLHGHLKVG